MSNSRTVYSTETGRLCPDCGEPVERCACRARARGCIQGDGSVRVGRETQGRKGKGVTVITGIPLAEDELKVLAKRLKQACGTGGTVKGGVVEIQGDHRDKVLEELSKHGYAAKKSGG